MTRIDLKYRKENLNDWEFKSLSEKNELGKFTLRSFFSFFSLILAVVLVSPYLPPLRAGGDYSIPHSLPEYLDEVGIGGMFIFSFILLIFLVDYIRNQIDLRWKIKKIGNFEVKGITKLGRETFIRMNDFNFLFIKSNHVGLKNIKKGQIITIKKTASNKVFSIYARSKSTFEAENNTTANSGLVQ